MPLGSIHLISEYVETGSGAIYFCGIEDAIAALHPSRLADLPRDAVCPDCLKAYEQQTQTKEP